jgi:hypothetical protein
VASFAVLQFAVATPLILLGLGWLYLRIFRNRLLRTPRWWLALCFSLPLLLVMSYKSLRYGIHLNWTLPAYLSVFPAVAQVNLAQWRCERKKLDGFAFVWRPAAIATVVVCLTLNVLGLFYALALQPRTGSIATLRPWPELAAEVQKVDDRLKAETGREPLVIGADKYRLASVLAFYRMPLESKVRVVDFTTSQWILGGDGLSYPYWAKEDQWVGCDCIVVDDKDDFGKFASLFKKFDVVDVFHLAHKTYYIGVGRGRLD